MLYDLNSYIVFVGLQWKSGRGRRSPLNRIFMHIVCGSTGIDVYRLYEWNNVSCPLRHLVLSIWDPCAVDDIIQKTSVPSSRDVLSVRSTG